MIVLFITVLLAVFLSSFLYLARSQQMLVVRARGWNSAMGLAEAGVEEALSQLNPGTPLPAVLDRTTNGWGAPVSGRYGPMCRTIGEGTYWVSYTADSPPFIYATGIVTTASGQAKLARAVKVGTTNIPLFALAIAVKTNVNCSGNSVLIDSYDTSNTNLSTSARYDVNKTSTNGTVASMFGLLNIGNADIYGKLLLGATASDTIKNNGFVTGGISQDFNADFPDVILPSTTWVPAMPQALPMIIDGVLYNYVFGYGVPASGDYLIANLTGNVYVGTNSSIRLRLTANASPGNIRVAGPGANAGKLVIYMDGPSFSLTGQDIVDGSVPANLNIYGTTNCTSVTMSGNATLIATVYAPQADMTLNGSGTNPIDFCGSAIGKSLTISGHFNIHFDESLARSGPARAYLANSWTEL